MCIFPLRFKVNLSVINVHFKQFGVSHILTHSILEYAISMILATLAISYTLIMLICCGVSDEKVNTVIP